MTGNTAEAGRSVISEIIAILRAFTTGGVHSLTEISYLTGLPISTVHRLASEPAAGRVLERTAEPHYRVGLPFAGHWQPSWPATHDVGVGAASHGRPRSDSQCGTQRL